MSSQPITLYDQRPLELQLEGGGDLSLKYHCRKAPPPEPHEETWHEILDDLKDLARKKTLKEFVGVYLRKDDVHWELVCQDKPSADEQALAVFEIYSGKGEKSLQNLRRKVKLYNERVSRGSAS